MRQKILDDIIASMKNKDKDKLTVLRMVKGAMQLEEINKKAELNDDEVVAVIAKQIKSRKESIVEFEKGNRNDLIEQTKKEIEILNEYMPEQLSVEEITKVVDEVFSIVKPTGQSDMGKIMGQLNGRLKGKADMSEVNKIVREKLSSL